MRAKRSDEPARIGKALPVARRDKSSRPDDFLRMDARANGADRPSPLPRPAAPAIM